MTDIEGENGKFSIYAESLFAFQYEISLLQNLNDIFKTSIQYTLYEVQSTLEQQQKSLIPEQKEIFDRFIKGHEAAGKVKDENIKIDVSFSKDEKLATLALQYMYFKSFGKDFYSVWNEMSLVYLILSFEKFLELIIGITYNIYPEALKFCNKEFKFKELLDFKNIEDLRLAMIEKEVKNLFEENIETIANYLNEKFKFDMAQNKNWKKIKERFYRRHIIIHNRGYPSKKYRERTGYRGKDVRLTITDGYLETSLKIFDSFAVDIFTHFKEKFKAYRSYPLTL